jgi:hypothetical protein
MKPRPWDEDIRELEMFFKSHKLPKGPIKLTEQVIIMDVMQFLKSHFAIVREHNGNERYRPYLSRLQQFKNL